MTDLPLPTPSFNPTDRQRAIHEALASKNPELGRRYLGLLHAAGNTRNPEWRVQAAHTARELINILPGAFSGLRVTAPKSRRADIMFRFAGKFLSLYRGGEPDSKYTELAKELERALESGKDRREELADEIVHSDPAARKHKLDLSKAADELFRLHNRLADIAHHNPTSDAEMRTLTQQFDSMLSALARPYFDTEGELEELINLDKPRGEDFQRLKLLLVKSALVEHFFRNTTSPEWFPFLRDAGYFTSATPIDQKGELVGCPEWPHAVYLAKCATTFPADVLQVISDVDTGNPRVHQQVVDVALALPPHMAKSLVDRSKKWLSSPYLRITLLPDRLSRLAVHLLTGSEVEKGFALAEILLDVTIEAPRDDASDELSFIDTRPEARSKLEGWQYEQALETLLPALIKADAPKTISLLGKLISNCIRMENSVRDQPDDHDLSYIWRDAIEDHEQNRNPHDTKDLLVVALRDACLNFARVGGVQTDTVFDLLGSFAYPLFRRIELHLLAFLPDYPKELLDRAVAEPDAHYGLPTHHEYSVLLSRRFADASEGARKNHLEWIDQGPDLGKFRERYRDWAGKPATESEVQKYLNEWRRDRLAPIIPYLATRRQKQYAELIASVGPPRRPEFLRYVESWSGPTSPVGVSDLSTMTPIAVFEFLRSWTPEGGIMSPSPDGLGRVLAATAQARPAEFSSALVPELAESLRPTYLFWLFHGLEQSIKDNSALNWECVAALAHKIARMRTSPVVEPPGEEMRTSWDSVHKAVASLISSGLNHAQMIPSGLREQIWSIVAPLTNAEEPTLEYERQYGGTNTDIVNMSVNTARGEAAHALFRYMQWVDLNANDGRTPSDQKHSIPEECLPVLDRFLNPQQEPTQTVRSVIGWYLVLLCALDLQWVRDRLGAILPDDAANAHLKNAVFEGYFAFNEPRVFLFENLRKFFNLAFEWALRPEGDSSFHRPKYRFVEHVLVLYWKGAESLDDTKSLIRRLYEQAPPDMRVYATEFTGRSLETLFSQVPSHLGALRRIQDLWDWRVMDIKRREAQECQEELKSFGWWVAHAQVDPKWILDRADEVLTMTNGALDDVHAVIKRFPELSRAEPLQAANVLDKLVRGDKEGWGIAIWEADTTAAFKAIKQTANAEAWKICVSTINYLGERGYRQYRNLLD